MSGETLDRKEQKSKPVPALPEVNPTASQSQPRPDRVASLWLVTSSLHAASGLLL